MASIARWLLMIPSIAVAWFLGIFSAFGIYVIDEKLCPPEYIISGDCFAPWSRTVHDLAFMVGPAIAAFLIVLLPSLLAPKHKKPISIIIYIVGVLVATYMLLDIGIGTDGREVRGFIAATVAGALGTFIVHKYLAKSS